MRQLRKVTLAACAVAILTCSESGTEPPLDAVLVDGKAGEGALDQRQGDVATSDGVPRDGPADKSLADTTLVTDGQGDGGSGAGFELQGGVYTGAHSSTAGGGFELFSHVGDPRGPAKLTVGQFELVTHAAVVR